MTREDRKMKKRFLPTILASDGREYTNVSYETLLEAEKALYDFCEIFLMHHDEKIIKAYIQ